MKGRKYQVVARIVKALDAYVTIDEETVFGPCPDEGAAISVGVFGEKRAVKADAGCVLTFRDGTKVRVRDTTPRGKQGGAGIVTLPLNRANTRRFT